jgi:hypothetical protein
MSQVGHADSTMTMDVYAQLEQRVDRRHGTAFDQLLRDAKSQHERWIGHELATRASGALSYSGASRPRAREKPAHAGFLEVARPGLEPATLRF